MDFGTVEVEKGDLATWVTGAVGLLSDGPGNRMGVAHLRGDGVAWSSPLPPRRAAVRAMQAGPRRPHGAPPARPRRAPRVGLGRGDRRSSTRATAGRGCGWSSRTSSSPTARIERPVRLGGAAAPPRRTPRRARRRGGRPARALACPTSGRWCWSIPRPVTGARCGPRSRGCASSTPPSPPRHRTAVAAGRPRLAGPPPRAAHRPRLGGRPGPLRAPSAARRRHGGRRPGSPR